MLRPFLLVVFALSSTAYVYDQCNTTDGPLSIGWGATCKAQVDGGGAGTPIDLCGASLLTTPPTISYSGYGTQSTVNLYNVGKTVQVENTTANATRIGSYSMSAGNLAFRVGRSTTDAVYTYSLLQIHAHWGRSGMTNEGSEHFLQGKAYPMEWHLVHWNTKYATPTAAISSGNNDALLVVGVFVQLDSSDNTFNAAVGSNLPGLPGKPGKSFTFAPTDLLTSAVTSSPWYSYGGSLTTPNCNEIVTWIVYREPVGITQATLNKFKNEMMNPGATSSSTYGTYGNFRPLVSKNGRTLYISTGSSDACGSATTTDKWVCSSGGTVNNPVVFTLLLASGLLGRQLM